MRYVSDEELNKMEQDGKYTWSSREITEHFYDSGGTFTLPKLEEEQHIMFQCLKCKSHFLLEECENCSNTIFTASQGGVFCRSCEQGFSSWTCPQCNTTNPAKKTLFLLKKKGGCFIATCVYGSYSAPEVRILRNFRDQVLIKNHAGQFFVNLYYAISPKIVAFIDNRQKIKSILKNAIIDPLVIYLKKDGKY